MAKLSVDNKTKIKIDKKALNEIRKTVCAKKDVELLIVNDDEIKELNKIHRKKNKPTDVLSFPVNFEFANFAGSIVISIDTAQKQADEQNHPLNSEVSILFIHGLLHLLGFDHESDKGEMREEEARICSSFNLVAPLTSRYT
jgi:probable rRNA maturation factor